MSVKGFLVTAAAAAVGVYIVTRVFPKFGW